MCQLWMMVLSPPECRRTCTHIPDTLLQPWPFPNTAGRFPFVPSWHLSVSESWAGSELGLQWAQAQPLDPKGHCVAESQDRNGHGGGSDSFWWTPGKAS